MSRYENPIKNYIVRNITTILQKNYPDLDLNAINLSEGITTPPNPALGQIAFPCFPLAKALKKGPPMIAQEIAKELACDDVIAKINPTGPYLNFEIAPSAFGKLAMEPILNGEIFKAPLLDDDALKTIMFEYSQPNTHKELHVGHMRNLCLGNALVRMNRYVGHKVIAATFPGDVGTHVAKCMWYLKYFNQEPIPTDKNELGPWLGALYTKATKQLEDLKDTPEEENAKKILTQILVELEAKTGEYYDLWLKTREWSIDLMKAVYKWADVEFDRWYFESEVDSESLAFAKKLYADGKLVESDGAIGMDLNDDGLGFCLLIKSDGTGLYATKDITLAYKKFSDYKFDESYYLVDKRQAFHFKQVFKTLEKLNFPHAKDCYHLQYDFVELPDGAMSSRKGNIVPLNDLIDEMVATIKTEYLEKYRGDWSDEEIDSTANIIANGAIKYGMIRMDIGRKIVFDMKEWLKLDGETGPYLQYTCARIHSLCEKQNYNSTINPNWAALSMPQEIRLMAKLTEFNDYVIAATAQNKTAAICAGLYETCKLFNSFYAECSIAKAENEELKTARLALSKATETVIKQGLAILGINAPKRM